MNRQQWNIESVRYIINLGIIHTAVLTWIIKYQMQRYSIDVAVTDIARAIAIQMPRSPRRSTPIKFNHK